MSDKNIVFMTLVVTIPQVNHLNPHPPPPLVVKSCFRIEIRVGHNSVYLGCSKLAPA